MDSPYKAQVMRGVDSRGTIMCKLINRLITAKATPIRIHADVTPKIPICSACFCAGRLIFIDYSSNAGMHAHEKPLCVKHIVNELRKLNICKPH